MPPSMTPGMCANCGKRPGTVKWVGEGGALAMSHGFYKMWCERCCTEAQLEYALKQVARVGELQAELDRLAAEESA